ncbi:hypothetical protein D3C81_1322140 [compost metagenome]
MRLVDQLAAHAVGGLVQAQEDHVVARRHDRGDALEVELEHVLDQVQFMLVQHARLGAGIDHGSDVLGGDLVDRLGRQAQQAQGGIRGGVEDPHQRLEHAQQRQHRVDHSQRAPLGEGHRDALGDQVGKLDEQQRHNQERADIGHALRVDHLHIRRQRFQQQVGHMFLAEDTGQDGHAVDADLHDSEEIPWLFLEQQYARGAAIAALGQDLELGAACGGQRDLGDGEEGADQDKSGQGQDEHRQSGACGQRVQAA